MGKLKHVTLQKARKVARGVNLLGLGLGFLVYLSAGVAVGLAWAGVGLADSLPQGWDWFWLALKTGGIPVAICVLWSMCSLGWMLASGLSAVQRMSRGWVSAIVLATLVGSFVLPWWSALIALALGLALWPVLHLTTKRVDSRRATSRGLPVEMLPALAQVPEKLPRDVEDILELAYRDWTHLRDIVGLMVDPTLRSNKDMQDLVHDADRTVSFLLRRSEVVGKLVDISNERRNDEASRKSADKALGRYRMVASVLHGAVSAAGEYAASDGRADVSELSSRVAVLRAQADLLDEHRSTDEELWDSRYKQWEESVRRLSAPSDARPSVPNTRVRDRGSLDNTESAEASAENDAHADAQDDARMSAAQRKA